MILLLCLCTAFPACAQGGNWPVTLEPRIAVFDIKEEKYIRSCTDSADLAELGEGEYYSFYTYFRYDGSEEINIDSLSVSVDGKDMGGWAVKSLSPSQEMGLHVYYSNMRHYMSEGEHTVCWYIDGEVIGTSTFVLTDSAEKEQEAIAVYAKTEAEKYGFPEYSDIFSLLF